MKQRKRVLKMMKTKKTNLRKNKRGGGTAIIVYKTAFTLEKCVSFKEKYPKKGLFNLKIAGAPPNE